MSGGSIAAPAPLLSLILCSRNDQYMGNSRWRLETTLNYLGQIVHELAREKHVEILVADWASERPLEEDLLLTPCAARITSFLAIPNAIAREVQGDSEFPEVIALNAAARRARGEYIGRIDQDTLVGRRFLEVFFDLYEGRRKLELPLKRALLFSNRRAFPYRFSVRCPELPDVHRIVDAFGHLMRVQTSRSKPVWRCVVGIWLVHRNLWAECGGYDERMIYLNDMEENMVVRLMQRYEFVNLGEYVDYSFYHLEHKHPWDHRKSARNRRVNDKAFKKPESFLANDAEWGLSGYPLEIHPAARATPTAPSRRLRGGWVAKWTIFSRSLLLDLMKIAGDLLMHSPAGRWVFQSYCTWQRRVEIAQEAMSGRPVTKWPEILGRLWADRASRT